MPVLGNNVIGGSLNTLTNTRLHGHFGLLYFPGSGAVIGSSFTVSMAFVHGKVIFGTNCTAQVGLYDASDPTPANWNLLATSNTALLLTTSPLQWHPLTWPVATYPAGTYALGVLCNGSASLDQSYDSAPGFTDGIRTVAPIMPGTFADPLGPVFLFAANYSLYLDWVAAGPAPGLGTFVPDCDCNRTFYK